MKNPQTGSTLHELPEKTPFRTILRALKQGQHVDEASGQADAKPTMETFSFWNCQRIDQTWMRLALVGRKKNQAAAKLARKPLGKNCVSDQSHRPHMPGNSFLATQCKRRGWPRSARLPPHGCEMRVGGAKMDLWSEQSP